VRNPPSWEIGELEPGEHERLLRSNPALANMPSAPPEPTYLEEKPIAQALQDKYIEAVGRRRKVGGPWPAAAEAAEPGWRWRIGQWRRNRGYPMYAHRTRTQDWQFGAYSWSPTDLFNDRRAEGRRDRPI
jgi:hypothetical protein